MNENERRFHNIVQMATDLCCLKVIWSLTIWARVFLNPWLDAQLQADESGLWGPPLMLILPLWVATTLRFKFYRAPELIRLLTIELSALENAFTLTVIAAIVTFCSREFGDSVSRLFVPVMLPIAFAVFSLSRGLSFAISGVARHHFRTTSRIALVGDLSGACQLIAGMPAAQSSLFWGVIVPERDIHSLPVSTVRVLGSTRQIAELINRDRLDRVIVLNASLPQDDFDYCSHILERMGMPMSYAVTSAPDSFHVDVNTIYGLPFLDLVPVQFTRQQAIIKRGFDILISLMSLLVLSPVLVLVAALIKVTSKGPVLYKSPRIGKGGRHFTFLKFRSMYVNSARPVSQGAEGKDGHIFKIKNDPRITPVGRVLRRYSLDELPQLINILRGEMSFVGPRPLPACDLGPDGMSKTFAAWSEGRASVLPGLTGLWQVSGRSDLSFEDMVRLDLSYIQNWSLTMDIKILLDTPMLVLKGAGAY